MSKQTFTTGQVLTAAQMTSLQQTAMGGGSTTAKTTSYVLTAADAGTVVQMNAAGATTITVNTALFAAGDSVQIQNIGAGVCTVTAGTATVSTAGSLALSQYEGGQLYFNTTSAALFFDIVQSSGMTNPLTTTGDTIYSSSGTTPARLGIGSTGQVLTVASGLPSWATPAGATAAWSQLGVSATTSGTTVTVSGLSGYNQIFISFENISSSTTVVNHTLRFNADSGANYNYSNYNIRNTGQFSGGYSSGDTSVYLARIAGAASKMSGGILINGANGTTKKFFSGFSSIDTDSTTSDITLPNIMGTYDGTSVISSVSILTSGTAFDLGNLRVFGSVA